MQLSTQKKKIGPYEYRVTQLDALAGRALFIRLAKIAGPAFGSFDAKNPQKSIADVFGKVAAGLSEEDLTVFCDVLGRSTEVAGGEYSERSPQLNDVFALHFAGKYLEMFQWLAFALEVNFGSFFKHALGSGAADKAPVATP
jgi:hypothetical protein